MPTRTRNRFGRREVGEMHAVRCSTPPLPVRQYRVCCESLPSVHSLLSAGESVRTAPRCARPVPDARAAPRRPHRPQQSNRPVQPSASCAHRRPAQLERPVTAAQARCHRTGLPSRGRAAHFRPRASVRRVADGMRFAAVVISGAADRGRGFRRSMRRGDPAPGRHRRAA